MLLRHQWPRTILFRLARDVPRPVSSTLAQVLHPQVVLIHLHPQDGKWGTITTVVEEVVTDAPSAERL